jgi:integrase
MAKHLNLKNKSQRRMLKPSRNAYMVSVPGRKGLSVGYRVNDESTTWVARRFNNEKYEFQFIGKTDDGTTADGEVYFTFDEAVGKAVEWFKEVQHVGVVSGPFTVQQAVEDYLKAKELEKRKPLQRDRATAKAHIYPALGHVELRKLTHQQVRAWHHGLAQSPAKTRTRAGETQRYRKPVGSEAEALQARQSTANRCLTVLKAALNYAKQETRRIGTSAAWEDVKPFKNADRKRERFLTLDESKNLVKACDVHFGKLVQGALYSGARYSELTHLRVADFNADDGSIFIAKSKSGLERTIYLGPEAIEFFKGMVQDRKPAETLFLKADGKPWKQSEQQRPMDKACDDAKIDNFTFHGLRHTFASQYRIAGGPLDVLKDILGHADLRMTMRYAKIGKSHLQEQSHRYAPVFGLMPTNEAANG